MKNVYMMLFLLLSLLFGMAAAAGAQDSNRELERSLLHHENPEIQAARAKICGWKNDRWAVRDLIELLGDEEEQVRSAAYESLKKITEQEFPPEQSRWETWYKQEGRTSFPATTPSEAGPRNTAKEYLNLSVMIAGISLGLLILFVVAFSIMGGYKLKQLKEIMKRAEEYVSQAEEVTRSTDNITDELEQKKVEMHEYISELKEEKEGELERHAELLEQNSAQKIREEMRSLRERAEKEVEHTLNDLQNGVSQRLKKELKNVQEDLKDDLDDAFKDFDREAEAQRVFLEASLYDITDKTEEALNKYEQVLDMKPDHHLAIQRKGQVLRRKGRFEAAVEDFLKALEHSPESPSIYYDLAATYARMNRKRKMLENLEKSVSIEPEYKDEALNDESFKDYWDDREFKDLAEA